MERPTAKLRPTVQRPRRHRAQWPSRPRVQGRVPRARPLIPSCLRACAMAAARSMAWTRCFNGQRSRPGSTAGVVVTVGGPEPRVDDQAGARRPGPAGGSGARRAHRQPRADGQASDDGGCRVPAWWVLATGPVSGHPRPPALCPRGGRTGPRGPPRGTPHAPGRSVFGERGGQGPPHGHLAGSPRPGKAPQACGQSRHAPAGGRRSSPRARSAAGIAGIAAPLSRARPPAGDTAWTR
jgi:hypothetical protein